VLFNFCHPILNSREGLSVRNVVGNYDSVGAFVVARSYSLEALLASSVPDLELNSLLVDVDCSNLKVYADSWHEVVGEHIILSKCSVRLITL
jgi:hypothetical protein